MLFMVNYVPYRKLESKKLEPKHLSLPPPPSRTLNRAGRAIGGGGEDADSAERRGLNIDHFTSREDGGIAVAVGVHRGEAAGVVVIDHLLTVDPVARRAERLLDGNRRGPITGMQRGNREESEEGSSLN